MSLLEDVFLEDETGEAERLERVIEGDEYEEVQNVNAENSDENSEKEDEAEEDKRRVDPTKPKRVVKNPRFVLNPARLSGPRGIQVIPEHFKNFKFKGKGHEREDLDMMLKKLEHWAYRLYPKFEFSDCLKKIETLGKKRPVMVHLHKIRTDQYKSEEIVEQKDSSDDEETQKPEEDEFDKLLQEQIKLARATPAAAPAAVKKPAYTTPMPDRSLSMPKPISSPSINDEQRERMLRNRRLAEERRLAKLNKTQETNNMQQCAVNNNTEKENDDVVTNDISPNIQMTQVTNTNKEVSKFNVNESPDTSDSECEMALVNQSVVADIHDTSGNISINPDFEMNQATCNNVADITSSELHNENASIVLSQSVDASEGIETTDHENNLGNLTKLEDIISKGKNEDVMITEIIDTNIMSENNKDENNYLNIDKAGDLNLDEQSESNTTVDTRAHKETDRKIYDQELAAVLSEKEISETGVASNDTMNKESSKSTDDCKEEPNIDQSEGNKISFKNADSIDKNDIKTVDDAERELIDEEIMDIDFSGDF